MGFCVFHKMVALIADKSNPRCFDLARMDTEVLDLIADDSAGVQKQKATYHWDKVGCYLGTLPPSLLGACTKENAQIILFSSLHSSHILRRVVIDIILEIPGRRFRLTLLARGLHSKYTHNGCSAHSRKARST